MIASLLSRLRDFPGVNLAIGLFSVLLVAALWSFVVIENRSERVAAVEVAVKQNSNLAVAYEEHIVRTLRGFDNTLKFVRYEYRRLGRRMDIARYIEDGVIDGQLFSIISVINERGDVVLSSKPFKPTNYADREFFQIHQRSPDRDLMHVSKPVLGRISDSWQVPMSRRISRDDGSFGGVIVLSVDPGYFARFYQKSDIGPSGAVMLVGLDGIARVRRVGDSLSFGIDMTETSLMREQAQSLNGNFLSQGGVDGTPRFFSYRTLPGFPLVVAVGAAEQEVLGNLIRRHNRDYLVALLLTMVILMFNAALLMAIRRQERSAIELATSEARFRSTFEQAAIGICHSSLERRFLAVNRTFCDMLGYTREELIGKPVWEIIHHDDRGDEPLFRDKLLSGELESHAAEKRYVRKDGRVIWVNRTISVVRDHAGEPLYFLRVVEDVTERKRLEQELQALAATDALTGLPNRRTFMARLEEEYARLRRFDTQQVAVLMLDVDYFKRVNDTHGHAAGDEVLRQVATLIREEPRRVDLCARIGGEEFAVILAGASAESAREFAERLRRKIAAAAIIFEGKALAVTVSVGVAAMRPADESADASLLRADGALYKAKEAGRNQVKLAEESAGAAGAAA